MGRDAPSAPWWVFALLLVAFGLSAASLGTWPGLFEDEGMEAKWGMVLLEHPLDWASLPQLPGYPAEGRIVEPLPNLFHLWSPHVGILFHLPLGLVQAALGYDVIGARALGLLAVWICAPFLAGIGRRAGCRPTEAWLLAAIVVSGLTATLLGHKVRPEAALAPLLVAVLWLVLRMERPSAPGFLGIGALVAAAIEIHVTHFPPLFALANLLLFLRFRSWKSLLWTGIPAAAGAGFWFWVRYGHGGWSFSRQAAESARYWGVTSGPLDKLGAFAGVIGTRLEMGVAGLPEFVAILAAFPLAAWVLLGRRGPAGAPCSLLAASFLVWPVLLLLQGRVNGNYFQPMFLLAVPVAWLALPGRFRTGSLAVPVLLVFLAGNLAVLGKKAWNSRAALAALPRVSATLAAHIPEGARVVGNETLYFAAPRMQLVGSRDLDKALRDEGFSSYVDRMKVEYVVDADYFDRLEPAGASADMRATLRDRFETVARLRFPTRASNSFLMDRPDGSSSDLVILRRKDRR